MRKPVDAYITGAVLAEHGKRGYDGFEDLADWGLNYNTPAQIKMTLRAWELMHNYNILPNTGGLDEQDPMLLDDIMTIERVYQYHKRRLKMEGAID